LLGDEHAEQCLASSISDSSRDQLVTANGRGISTRSFTVSAASFALIIVSLAANTFAVVWPIESGGNGHDYEAIGSGYLTWFAARDAAASSSMLGTPGHLATVTSAGEQDFLLTMIGSEILMSKWLGGFRTTITPEPSEGWSWITGEPWSYTAWAPGEPNNANINETALQYHFNFGFRSGWNDLKPANDDRSNGYVVEFDVPEPGSAIASLLLVAALAHSRRGAH